MIFKPPEVHWRDFNNVLWLRGVDVGKVNPGIGENTWHLRRKVRPFLMQYFRGLFLWNEKMVAEVSIPNHQLQLFKSKDEVEAEEPPPNGPVIHILNQTLIKKLFKISVRRILRIILSLQIKSLSFWNDIAFVSLTCVIRLRYWQRNMETGETILGGPVQLPNSIIY